MPGDALADVADLLTWYSHVDTSTTVDVINDVLSRRRDGATVFHHIYTDAEKSADPALKDTGLFVFPAQQDAASGRPRVAVCSAGGGFAYVASAGGWSPSPGDATALPRWAEPSPMGPGCG